MSLTGVPAASRSCVRATMCSGCVSSTKRTRGSMDAGYATGRAMTILRPDSTSRDAAMIRSAPGGARMRPNKIKQLWREGRCVTMGWLSISNGFTAEVMARQGFDGAVVDMQQVLTDRANLGRMLQAISQPAPVRVVRVAWNAPATIMRALVFGA